MSTIVISYDGAPITNNVAVSGIEITHRADMGEASMGGIPIEDPDGTLAIVGHRPFTVDDTACSQPRLFTGWTAERAIAREVEKGLFVGPDPRLQDTTIVDINAAFGFRQITGADGNRPAETWQARCTWILQSDYLDDSISHSEDFVVTNTVTMDPADYRGSTPSAVMDDLSDRSGNAYTYFLFWCPATTEITLFFDNDSESIGLSTLSISSVWADRSATCIVLVSAAGDPAPVVSLAREPDQVYSEVVVEYNDGTQKLFRKRPSTEAAYIRRGTTIQRPYTKGLATATAQAEKWLDEHSVETDRITCTIRVPAASVGLIQAGQSIAARFSHLGAPYAAAGGATMRIVSCSPKPTDDTGYWYDVALELVYRPAASTTSPCTEAAIEWMEDGATTFNSSPKTTAIPTPSFTNAVIIGHLQLKYSYHYTGDYLANVLTVASPWTMIGTDSDPLDLGYRTRICGVAYHAWSGGAVPDLVHSWSGVYTRPGEGYVISAAINTAATAPVQLGEAISSLAGSHIDLADPPTEGNLLVLCVFRAMGGSLVSNGWTLIRSSRCLGDGDDLNEIWARCALADEDTVIPVLDSSNPVRWYLSEWVVSEVDTVIDLGPAPATTPRGTTTHTTDPAVTDDGAAGYGVGSVWVNETTGKAFILVDNTTGAAVWVETTSGGTVYAPTTADYLVGTAQGGLSAEIVVGTTPGGELGGTWASPTVDATHSGSAHLALGSTSSTAAAGDHSHASATGVAFLLVDGHSTPFVFDDLLQNEAGDDFLYADI